MAQQSSEGMPRVVTPGEKQAKAHEVLEIYHFFFYVCLWLPFVFPFKMVMRPRQSSVKLERYQRSGDSLVCCKLLFIKGVACQ